VRSALALSLLVATSLAAGAAGCGAKEGTLLECYHPSVCPGQETECGRRTCEAGQCGLTVEPAGFPLPFQIPGDCNQRICDGAGAVVALVDDSDVPDDLTQPCLQGSCAAGVPSMTPLPGNTGCYPSLTGVYGFCDGAGTCR
jgi:hypothetical protein